jgi:hypothetical protein
VQIQHFEIFTPLWAEMNGCGGSDGIFEFLARKRFLGAVGGSGNGKFSAAEAVGGSGAIRGTNRGPLLLAFACRCLWLLVLWLRETLLSTLRGF